jgi:hypothetical protein
MEWELMHDIYIDNEGDFIAQKLCYKLHVSRN